MNENLFFYFLGQVYFGFEWILMETLKHNVLMYGFFTRGMYHKTFTTVISSIP